MPCSFLVPHFRPALVSVRSENVLRTNWRARSSCSISSVIVKSKSHAGGLPGNSSSKVMPGFGCVQLSSMRTVNSSPGWMGRSGIQVRDW